LISLTNDNFPEKLHSASGTESGQNGILIISDNSCAASQLNQHLAKKGYRTFSVAPFDATLCLKTERSALIVLLDRPADCRSVIDYLNAHCVISDLPAICMCSGKCTGKPANVEQIVIDECPPNSAALEMLESRVQFYLRRSKEEAASFLEPAFFYERRISERRKLIHSPGQTQAVSQVPVMAPLDLGDTLGPEENHGPISLSILSQRKPLFEQIQGYFNGMPTVSLFMISVDSPERVPVSLEQKSSDLLLVDAGLSVFSVREWLTAVKKKNPRIKIVLLYDNEMPDLINEIVEFGIAGLIKADAGCHLFRKAVRTVHAGEFWLPHRLINQVLTVNANQRSLPMTTSHLQLPGVLRTHQLSRHEQCIIELVGQGMTNKEIAECLSISVETVKKKLTMIFEKFDVRSRSHLVSIYLSSLKDRPGKNSE
jgi:DNA-binding NarL/FixJ family response regulator